MVPRHPVAALLIVLAGCASGPDVTTDYAPATDFTGYRTYSWVYGGVPTGMNPLMFQRVQASIDRSLAARNYTQASPGDFAIAFTVGRRDRVEVTDFGPYAPYYRGWGWGPAYRTIDVRNVSDGTLVIDIYDASTKQAVWHGVATQEIAPENVDQATIDKAVDAVLAEFPPTPGAES